MYNYDNVMNTFGWPVKLLIVKEHRLAILGCRAVLANDPHVEIAQAETLAAARTAIADSKPDVLLIGAHLPDGSGLDFTKELRAAQSGVKAIIFSPGNTAVQAMQAIEAGAVAFVTRATDPMDLRAAILAVARGERWFPADLVQEMALMRSRGSSPAAALSDREIRVLRELVRGRSMAEIAGTLTVSYKTVTNDCSSLRTKLNARTNPQLVRIAMEMRLA